MTNDPQRMLCRFLTGPANCYKTQATRRTFSIVLAPASTTPLAPFFNFSIKLAMIDSVMVLLLRLLCRLNPSYYGGVCRFSRPRLFCAFAKNIFLYVGLVDVPLCQAMYRYSILPWCKRRGCVPRVLTVRCTLGAPKTIRRLLSAHDHEESKLLEYTSIQAKNPYSGGTLWSLCFSVLQFSGVHGGIWIGSGIGEDISQ